MVRIIRSKWFSVGLFASALLAAGVGAFLSARAPAEEAAIQQQCVNCGREKIEVRTLPDGTLHPETIAARAAVQQQLIEEQRQEALERFNTWHGTQGFMPDSVPAASHDLYKAVAQAFDSDPPPPEQRLVYFATFIEGEPQYKCVGWSVDVVSIAPNQNGWEATVHVRPQLAQKEGGGVLYTPGATIEKWQIAQDGTATVLDVQFGSGRGVIFID